MNYDFITTYPPCPNAGCDHTWCFMERRDLDECPACGWAIPEEYRLDANLEPVS